MRTAVILATTVGCLIALAAPAQAFRCGEGNRFLASEGMHKYQILKDCGPAASEEIVGVDERGGSHRIVEEWLYVVDDRGRNQLYLIKFDRDGVAVRIEWLGAEKE